MHIADFSVGMLGANGVVAAGLPIAAGAAHAQKLRGLDGVTACFFGDGAINRGPFLEALNWAQVYHLPVLLVCEDNRWSATTESSAMTAGDGASVRAQSLGIDGEKVDGNDVLAVWAAARRLVSQVRDGRGPRLLHAVTYRVKGHVSVDAAAYRDPAALEAALKTDPIARFRSVCTARGVSRTALDAIDAAAQQEVQAALAAAAAAPWPQASDAYTEVQTTGAGQWY
jgi:pyruvate dehydrogenase E1 component alpha subunit